MPLPAPLLGRQVRAGPVLGALSERGHLRGLPLRYASVFPAGLLPAPRPNPQTHGPPRANPQPLPCLLLCLLHPSAQGPGSGRGAPRPRSRSHILSTGVPTCRCPNGFTGPKCTQQVCAGYCANNSTCTVNQGNQPQCRCLPGFLGDRCQFRELATPGPRGRARGAGGLRAWQGSHRCASQGGRPFVAWPGQAAGAPWWGCGRFL